MDYQQYRGNKPLCSVNGCELKADYEVILYDHYSHSNETFFEQDITCPFICEKHMAENEEQSIGEKRPRGYVQYPFTNKRGAQGYTKYIALQDSSET